MKSFILCLCLLLAPVIAAKPGQKIPDAKRQQQIAAALESRGYLAPGPHAWPEIQETCRQIADSHGWQVNRAPEARVLILLGLGSRHSNPEVAEQPGNRLDQLQRHEVKEASE
jgi:hypothetical protein